jgi:hypothetical protein
MTGIRDCRSLAGLRFRLVYRHRHNCFHILTSV